MFRFFAFVAFGTYMLDLLDGRNHSIILISTADCMHVVDWLRLLCRTANSRPMCLAIRHTPPSWYRYLTSKPWEQRRDSQRQTTVTQGHQLQWPTVSAPSTKTRPMLIWVNVKLARSTSRHRAQTSRGLSTHVQRTCSYRDSACLGARAVCAMETGDAMVWYSRV